MKVQYLKCLLVLCFLSVVGVLVSRQFGFFERKGEIALKAESASQWRELLFDTKNMGYKGASVGLYELRVQASNLSYKIISEEEFCFLIVIYKGNRVHQEQLVNEPRAEYYSTPRIYTLMTFSGRELGQIDKIVVSYVGGSDLGVGQVELAPSMRP